jgi:excisionase family DNA binding protein
VLQHQSVPNAYPDREGMWLTTAQVAQRLRVSTRWVRWLARHGELPYDGTGAGQRLFRREDVWRYRERRDRAAERSRSARLAALRPRMVYSSLTPRQRDLPGLGPRQLLRLTGGERSDPQAEVKGPEVRMNASGSDNRSYVNRKATAASR